MAKMQTSLNSIEAWAERWRMVLSTSKTKVMIFSHKRKLIYESLRLQNKSLEGVKLHKFLGMILDKELTWRNHIEKTVFKYQRDLSIMSIVSARGWGADYDTLRAMYIALVHSKINYGSFPYETASKSNLLDRIQYAAVRFMLGALKCTSVDRLEVEGNLTPLALRRKQLLSQYLHRSMSMQGHPFRELMKIYYHFDFYKNNKRPLPVTARGYEELLQVKDIPVLNMGAHYRITPLPINSPVAIRKNPIGCRAMVTTPQRFTGSSVCRMGASLY